MLRKHERIAEPNLSVIYTVRTRDSIYCPDSRQCAAYIGTEYVFGLP